MSLESSLEWEEIFFIGKNMGLDSKSSKKLDLGLQKDVPNKTLCYYHTPVKIDNFNVSLNNILY